VFPNGECLSFVVTAHILRVQFHPLSLTLFFFFLLLATNYAHAYSDNTFKLGTFFLCLQEFFSFGLC